MSLWEQVAVEAVMRWGVKITQSWDSKGRAVGRATLRREMNQEGDWVAWQEWKAYIATQRGGAPGRAILL